MKAVTDGPPTLIVFCRRPGHGVGKQRIAASRGSSFALALASGLLAAALEDARGWPGPVVIAPACAADASWASELLSRPAQVVPQIEGNLGQRLNAVDAAVRSGGAQRLIYIGTDAPLLDYAYYARARLALDRDDVVLGPAEDGGVTLMGARHPWPDLASLPWSGPSLGESLDRRCRARGLSVRLLDPQYDVDEADQLPRLYTDLGRDPRPARRALRDLLESHGIAEQIKPTVVMAGQRD
jgi:glycosyltransferase A (GT-A) superfamily protein (DUF2064 family)